MKSLLFYFFQTIICSGILYGYYYIFLCNKKFHLYNRYYLLTAVAISIIIPLLNIPVYFEAIPDNSSAFVQVLTVFSSDTTQPIITTGGSAAVITSFFTRENIFKIVYAIVASVIFIRFLIAIFHIIKLIKNYVADRIDHIYFINTNEPGTPFSFFKWLFWNEKIDLNSEKGEQIFRHELFHIRQKHSLDIVFFEMLTVIFWINPFFHFFKKEIKAIHEFLADEFAIKENEEWNYAELLLMQVLKSPNHLLNPFFHNQIKRRIAMITLSKKPSYQYLRKIMVLPVAAIVIALFAFTYKQRINQKTAESKIPIQDTIKQKERNPNKQFTVNKIVDTLPKALENKDCLIVVDGKIIDSSSLRNINPTDISSMNVLKGPYAIAKYGEKGKNGVIEITIKENHQTDTLRPIISLPGIDIRVNTVVIKDPAYKTQNSIIIPDLIIFNNKEYSAVDFYRVVVGYGRVETKFGTIIPPNDLESIKKYGDRAKNGVIVFEDAKIVYVKPEIKSVDLKKASLTSLLKLPPDAKVISCTFTINTDEGTILESVNTGNDFSANTVNLIQTAAPGKLMTIGDITIEKDGKIKKIPGLVYWVIDSLGNNSEFLNQRRNVISEIKAIARKEGKAAYIYKGRTYVFARINNPDPTIATFAEQDGTNHVFLLNGELVTSIDEINKHFTRNDVIKLGLMSKEESIKRFNVNDAIVSIETFDNNLITKNK
jgi:hypothetical protein